MQNTYKVFRLITQHKIKSFDSLVKTRNDNLNIANNLWNNENDNLTMEMTWSETGDAQAKV